MPKRNQHNSKSSPLLEEIRSIEGCSPEATMPDAASLCVLRVVPGLDAPAWASLSLSHGLGHWCAVPLGCPTPRAELLAQAIGQLAAGSARPDLRAFLRTEIERSRACAVPLALALIQPDVMRTKTVQTDCPQSEAGLLQALLDLVQGLKRSFDHAALLGGERLALVFSGTSLNEAERMVGAILRRIRTPAANKGGRGADCDADCGASLLCSAGLAGYGGCVELTPDEFIASADKALDKARGLGGNRLEVAAPVDVCLASRNTLVHAGEKHFLFTGKKAGDK
jgi:GGDEF domain-containing protein